MSYQVLARKWRPTRFSEMVGQEHVLRALVNALDRDRLHHAYLFTGTRGVGKTTIARIFAKCLNCEEGVSSDPCGRCASCLEIAEGRSVDLLEVDAASRTKVEDTRELLENVQYAPTRSRYKVYLIDEVHMLSGHSFNALLKTLEEPPPHVKFLLATTDPQKLPATVLSRCLQFNLKNMPPEQIAGHLARILGEEGVEFDEAALWLLGSAAAGSMRDALSLTDQAIAFGSGRVTEDDVRSMLGTVDRSFVYELLEAVAAGDAAGVLATIARMAELAPDFEGSLDELISLVHRVVVAQAVPEAIDKRWGDSERVAGIAGRVTAEDAQLFYQIAINGKRDLPLAVDPRSGFEMTLLRMVAFRPEPAGGRPVAAAESGSIPSAAGSAQGARSGKNADSRGAALAKAATPAAHTRPPAEPGMAVERALTPIAPPAGPVSESAREGFMELGDLTPASWHTLLEGLGLAGMVYNIARHSELREVRGAHLQFVLDADNSSLFNDDHARKIRLALENYFNRSLTVEIDLGEPVRETPAMRQARLSRERQQAAVASLEADPVLQNLITRFDGELDRSSITSAES